MTLGRFLGKGVFEMMIGSAVCARSQCVQNRKSFDFWEDFFLEPGSTWDCVWETTLTVRQTIDIHCVLSTRGHICYTLVTITCGIVCENVELNFHSVFLCLLKLKCAFFHLRPLYVLIYMYSMYSSSYSDVYSPVSLSHMIELHAPRTWEFDFKPALSKSVHQYNDNVTCLLEGKSPWWNKWFVLKNLSLYIYFLIALV